MHNHFARAALCLVCGLVFSEPSTGVVLGYVTGNDYLALPDEARMGWLIGALDGMMAESIALEKDSNGPWLGRCVRSFDNSQIKAIFEKQLAANPESWHAPAAMILRGRLWEVCNSKTGA